MKNPTKLAIILSLSAVTALFPIYQIVSLSKKEVELSQNKTNSTMDIWSKLKIETDASGVPKPIIPSNFPLRMVGDNTLEITKSNLYSTIYIRENMGPEKIYRLGMILDDIIDGTIKVAREDLNTNQIRRISHLYKSCNRLAWGIAVENNKGTNTTGEIE